MNQNVDALMFSEHLSYQGICFTKASTAVRSLRSAGNTYACPPCAWICSARVCSAVASRATINTLAPAVAACCATSAPMPRDAPVTSTAFYRQGRAHSGSGAGGFRPGGLRSNAPVFAHTPQAAGTGGWCRRAHAACSYRRSNNKIKQFTDKFATKRPAVFHVSARKNLYTRRNFCWRCS